LLNSDRQSKPNTVHSQIP